MESVRLLDFHDLLAMELTKFIDHGYLELYCNFFMALSMPVRLVAIITTKTSNGYNLSLMEYLP